MSFILERYEVFELLGEGGMSQVFRARARLDGKIVALKTLREPLDLAISGLNREIRIMTQLRHPGILRVLDHGMHEGVPWYTMPLLEGMEMREALDLARRRRNIGPTDQMNPLFGEEASTAEDLPEATREFLDLAGDAPITWMGEDDTSLADRTRKVISKQGHGSEVLDWVVQLCHALAYMHGQGVIHCDLKPENVFITPAGEAIIFDFGIATFVGGKLPMESLQMAGLLAGTPTYMAPEQLTGQEIDARADLYALGCMLFEIFAGQTPFDFPTIVQILQAKQKERPAPLSDRVDGVPAHLEDMIMRMLEHDVTRRPGHALLIANALDAVGARASKAWVDVPIKDFLYHPTLKGRDPLLTRLRTRIDQSWSGQGGGIALVGASGMGKSRMAAELIKYARKRAQVIIARSSPHASLEDGQLLPGRPLSLFQPVLEASREQQSPSNLENSSDDLLAAYLDDADTSRLHENMAPEAMRELLARAITSSLDRYVGGAPLVLVFEDVQWADELSLDMVQRLLDGLGDRPWLILLLERTDPSSKPLGPLEQVTSREDVAVYCWNKLVPRVFPGHD